MQYLCRRWLIYNTCAVVQMPGPPSMKKKKEYFPPRTFAFDYSFWMSGQSSVHPWSLWWRAPDSTLIKSSRIFEIRIFFHLKKILCCQCLWFTSRHRNIYDMLDLISGRRIQFKLFMSIGSNFPTALLPVKYEHCRRYDAFIYCVVMHHTHLLSYMYHSHQRILCNKH